jgi:hypothetical protein
LVAVGVVSRGISVTNQRLRTLAVGTWLLPDFSHEAEKLVMTEGQEMGEFKAHAGIIQARAN